MQFDAACEQTNKHTAKAMATYAAAISLCRWRGRRRARRQLPTLEIMHPSSIYLPAHDAFNNGNLSKWPTRLLPAKSST